MVASLPIVAGWLLGDDRKQMYLTNEAPGLMPVACPRAVDNRGLELMTRQGNMPLLIDFVSKHRGILIFGETRSGKSVLAAEIFVWAIANGIEAAVLALSAQSMAFRRALEVTDSLFAIDESPILFKYNGIAQIIGQVCANGAKFGIRPLIIGQDPDTIANSVAGSQILQNLNTRFVGAIQPNALPS